MKSKLLMAALAGYAIASVSTAAETAKKPADTKTTAMGECHGVNACKGQGICGGNGHECAGKNACKGQGRLSTTEKDCKSQKGKWKASAGGMHAMPATAPDAAPEAKKTK